jgi:1-acyl-sn-glycerol-3-phosphate acyltransferase
MDVTTRSDGGAAEIDAWWTVARGIIGAACFLGFRFEVAGERNVPATGGAVVAANHVSVLDPLAVALAVARRRRAVRYLALAEVFDQRFVGWALRRMRQVPLRRGIGDWQAIGQIADLARSGALVGFSAEGRVGDGDALQPIQKGAARAALAAGVPVIPAGIWGTQSRWPMTGPRMSPPLRPGLAVVFGSPIPSVGDPRSRADVRALTDRIAAALEPAVEEARRRCGLSAASLAGR